MRFANPGVSLSDALRPTLHVSAPATLADLIEEFGGIGPVALFVTGAQSKRDKSYLAARRRVERYLDKTRGSRALDPWLESVKADLEATRGRLRQRGIDFTIRATFTIRSAGKKPDIRKRTMRGDLSDESTANVIDAAAVGDWFEAADRFAFLWGLERWGGTVPEITDVTWLDIREGGMW